MKPLLFVFALLLVFNQVAVSAQTGPKDEIKQPATDLDRGQGRADGAGFYA